MIGVSIASRWWLQKRIQREIETLMNYTHKLMDLDTKSEFIGSKIYEFDYFGRTLEQSFRRLANKEKQFEICLTLRFHRPCFGIPLVG